MGGHLIRLKSLPTILLLLTFRFSHAAWAAEELPLRHFDAKTPEEVEEWQADSRRLLFDLLKMSDLVEERDESLAAIQFEVETLSTEDRGDYTLQEIELSSTPTRRIKAILTIPAATDHKSPAVVCIHGHGGNRQIVYDHSSLYRGFADELAKNGYVTISTDVGQHKVYEEGRSLMGERLWDVIRCADYLATRDDVDADRMGCAGLSLGGEMAMWLGAMDPRMKVVVSSGFLTSVENLRTGHCQCWNFPGFTENFGFSDVYSLTAPRPLLCQIGAKERYPGGFPASIAHREMAEIQRCYEVYRRGHLARLDVHSEGHVFDTPNGCRFIDEHLRPQEKAHGG